MKPKIFAPLVFASLIFAAVSLGCEIFGIPMSTTEQAPISLQTATIQVTLPAPATPVVTSPAESPPPASPIPPTEASPQPEVATQAPPASQPDLTAGCKEETCISTGTFLLGRPVGQGGRNTVDPSNRYGEYQRSTRSANLGADFLNSTGASVVAAAGGKVIAAGDDSQTAYTNRNNVYGNLVILEHNLPGVSNPIYTLYAHLSEVLVNEGDTVEGGQEIGKVGMSGNVSGSTLHFEARVGENSPDAALNPDLWLAPVQGKDGQLSGALAGSIQDEAGNYIEMGNIVLELLAGAGQPAQDQLYIQTYSDKKMRGRAPWEESFAVGELVPGTYQVSFWLVNVMHQQVVEVEPGKLTVVRFKVK
jgi:murein DD-endopeptidase MepM/ murein hydrolase activator NlpD